MKKGFTIIESLIAVVLSSTLGIAIVNYQIDQTKTLKTDLMYSNINELLDGVDQRLYADGYDENLWSKKKWNNNEINSLVESQLQAINSKCGTGIWNPIDPNNKKLKLVSCNLFKKRVYPINISAELKSDSAGFINKFIVDYSFNGMADFNKYFKEFNKSVLFAKANKKSRITGKVFYQYIDKDTNNEINVSECIVKKEKCLFRTTLDRQAGSEYLRVDGLNSMIKSRVSFIQTKGLSPLKCIKWSNVSGNWHSEIVEKCGIGFSDTTPTPTSINVNVKEGVFESIKLNQLCKVFDWNNGIVERHTKEPCGISKNGSYIYQVMPTIIAEKGVFKYVNIENIIATNITAKNVEINNKLTVNGITQLKGSTNINVPDLNITSDTDINIHSKTNFKKPIRTEQGIENFNQIYNHGITTNIGATNTNELFVNNVLNINTITTEDSYCKRIGDVKRTNKGDLLSCVDNKWKKSDSMPIGSIVLWSSTRLPNNWIELNGQSTYPYPKLRSIVGSNVPDVRGLFIRALDNNKGIDKNRSLGSYQADELKSHNHTDYQPLQYGGTKDLPSLIETKYSDERFVDLGAKTGYYGGIETRPKNIALIYIIKAK